MDARDRYASARLALKRIRSQARSSLLPARGLPALAGTPLPQRSLSMNERRHAREHGARLADFRAFTDLSDPERTTLGTFATETHVERGATIVGRGEVARELASCPTSRRSCSGSRARSSGHRGRA